jgi:hypothetical protein
MPLFAWRSAISDCIFQEQYFHDCPAEVLHPVRTFMAQDSFVAVYCGFLPFEPGGAKPWGGAV